MSYEGLTFRKSWKGDKTEIKRADVQSLKSHGERVRAYVEIIGIGLAVRTSPKLPTGLEIFHHYYAQLLCP
jgi:hypothetical protein